MKAACITHTGVSDAIRVAAGRARSSSSRERPGLHGGGRLALRRLTATNPPLDGVDPRGEIRKHRRSQSGLGHGVRRRSRVGRLSLASLSLGRAALRWIPLGPRLGATIGCRGRWQRLDGVRPGSRRRRRRDVGTLLRSRGPCGKRGVCLHGDVLRHHEIPRVGRPLPRRRSGRRRRRHGDRSGRAANGSGMSPTVAASAGGPMSLDGVTVGVAAVCSAAVTGSDAGCAAGVTGSDA